MYDDVQSSSNVYQLPKGADKTAGRWTEEEHRLFIIGLNKFGKNWKKIEQVIKTRSGSQIRSHAQKYFNKLSKQVGKTALFPEDFETCLPNLNGNDPYIAVQPAPQPSKNGAQLLAKADLEEISRQNISYLPAKNSYLSGEITEQPSNMSNRQHQDNLVHSLLEQNPAQSYFFSHIFASPFEVLNSNFYQLFVDYQVPSHKDLLPLIKQESVEQVKKVSFKPFSAPEPKEETAKHETCEVKIVIPIRV